MRYVKKLGFQGMLGSAHLHPGAGGVGRATGPSQAPRASLGALSPSHPWASLWVPRSSVRTATGGQPVPSPVCPQTRARNDPTFSVGQALSALCAFPASHSTPVQHALHATVCYRVSFLAPPASLGTLRGPRASFLTFTLAQTQSSAWCVRSVRCLC